MSLFQGMTDSEFRDRWGRPQIAGGGKLRGYSRASGYGDIIESTWNLDQWKKRMAGIGVAGNPDLIELILDEVPKLDDEDYSVVREAKAAIQQHVEEGMNRAGQNDRAELGTHRHALTEYVDRGDDLPTEHAGRPVTADDRKDLDAYWKATREFEMLAIETFVVCDELEVAGTFDRLVRYNGETYIFDLKTSTSTDFGGTKFGVQLATYSRGVPYSLDDVFQLSLDDYKQAAKDGVEFRRPWQHGPVNQDWGIILHLPAGEARAIPKWIDLREGWKCALLSQTIRQQRRFKKWYQPMGITPTEDASPFEDGLVIDSFESLVRGCMDVPRLYEFHAAAKAKGVDITAICAARKVELLGSR